MFCPVVDQFAEFIDIDQVLIASCNSLHGEEFIHGNNGSVFCLILHTLRQSTAISKTLSPSSCPGR